MNGGYNFEDSRPYGGADRGVWTPQERAAEGVRRRAAQKAAADAAYAAMEAQINAINSNGALTQWQKVNAISQLRASGFSRAEFSLIWEAKAAAEALL